ncbi:putative pectin lyase [Dirofilaria immitis]
MLTKVVGLEVLTRLADADGSQALSDHCHDAGTFACCLSALSRTPLIIQPGAGDTPAPTPCRRHAWPGRSVATAKNQPELLLSLHPPPHASQSLGLQALATTPGERSKFLHSYTRPSHISTFYSIFVL